MSIIYFKKRKLSVIFPLLLTACAGKGGFDSNIIAEDQSVKPNTQGEQLPPDTGEAPKDNQYSSGYEVKIPSRNLAVYDENGQKIGVEQGADYVHNNDGGRERKLVKLDKQREDIAYIDIENRSSLSDTTFKLTEEDKKNGFNYISLGFRSSSPQIINKQLPADSSTPHTILKEVDNALYYHGSNTAKSLPQNIKVKYNGAWYFITDARRKGHGTDFGAENWDVGKDYGATSDKEDGKHTSEFEVDFGTKKLTGSLKKVPRLNKDKEVVRYKIEADLEKNRFKGKATAVSPIKYKKVNNEDPNPENDLYFYEHSNNVEGGFYGHNAEELLGGFSTGETKKTSTFVAFGAKRGEIDPNHLERKVDATKINVSTEDNFIATDLDSYMDISKLVIDGKEFSLSTTNQYNIKECCNYHDTKDVKFGSFTRTNKDNNNSAKDSENIRIKSYEDLITKYYSILIKLESVEDISLTTLADLKFDLNTLKENGDQEDITRLLQLLDFKDPATNQAFNFNEKLTELIKENLSAEKPEYAVNIFKSIGFDLEKALHTLNIKLDDLKSFNHQDDEDEENEDETEIAENEMDEGEVEENESEGKSAERKDKKNNENNKKYEELITHIKQNINIDHPTIAEDIANKMEWEDIDINAILKLKNNAVKHIKANHSLLKGVTNKDIQVAITISILAENLDFKDQSIIALLAIKDEESTLNSNTSGSNLDRLIAAYNHNENIIDELINKLSSDAQKTLQANLKNGLTPSKIDHYGEHLFIQGNRTPKNEIPNTGKFSYKGKWQGVFKQNSIEKTEKSLYKYNDESNTYTKVGSEDTKYNHIANAYGSAHTDGSADFSVDFSNKTLNGYLYNSHSADNNSQKITISEGKIDGTTFSAKAYTEGEVTLNGIRDDSKLTKIKIDKTDVKGAFYGPQAKELGGHFIVNQFEVKRDAPTITDNSGNGNKEINQKTIINETRGAVVFGATQTESK